MNTILNSINESVKALTANIEAAAKSLYAEANTRKEKLAAAIQDMREMYNTMKEFANIRKAFDPIVLACADMEVAGDYVNTMLSDMDVYTASVEHFNGYCDNCGVEMTVNDQAHITDEDEFVCEKCWSAMNEEAPEQLKISVEEKSE